MARPSLATKISSLLVCAMIITPAVGFAEEGDRGPVSSVAEREKPRRTDYEARGREAIESGNAAMKVKDYEKATAYYKSACDMIPNAPLFHRLYGVALGKFCDASVKLATQRITEGRYLDAEDILRVVLDERYDPHFKKATVMLSRLEHPDYYSETTGPKLQESSQQVKLEQVKQYFIEAQGFYDTGRYALAKKRCEQILKIDPDNIAARKFEEKTDEAMDDYGSKVYNGSGSALDLNEAIIRRKLERIIIPKLEFRDATVREAIDFLEKKIDVDSNGRAGLNITLKLNGSGGAVAGPAAAPGTQITPIPGTPISDPGSVPAIPERRITVSLTNISLLEALKYVTGLANLKFKIEPDGISIVPASAVSDVLVTKEWKIPPDLIPRTPEEAGITQGISAPSADATKGGSKIADRLTAKNWLIANGVVFNGAASAVYITKSSRLIVRNTQDQLDLVDTIISSIVPGIEPVRVEIECKFVEVQQNGTKVVSADSLTAGNGSIGNHANSPNIIEELLFPVAGASSLPPGVGALAGVFTDPQFQLVMRALNQRKGVDITFAPKVTLKSGQRGVVEVIRESRLSEELTPPQVAKSNSSPTGIGNSSSGNGPTSKVSIPTTPTAPRSSENRNLGVTLEVTPVVGPDGYTIDLNLTSQVVEFEGDVGHVNPMSGRLTPSVADQSIFSTQKITTSVSVFDCSTVVLSGLLREDLSQVQVQDSRIGDAPKIGPSVGPAAGQQMKRNLLIFVSARLINPGSGPVRDDDEKEEVTDLIAPPEVAPQEQLPLMPK